MKILTGQLKGRNFFMPAIIRPTQNVVRKAVFDLVGHDLSGLAVLDLFAGSGAVGLEAVSLGAKQITFVEKTAKCVDIIDENLRILGLKDRESDRERCRVMSGDVFATIKLLAELGRKFDIIFLDPPYSRGMVRKTLKTLGACDILHRASFVVAQFHLREPLPEEEGRLSFIKRKKYGKSFLAVYEGR